MSPITVSTFLSVTVVVQHFLLTHSRPTTTTSPPIVTTRATGAPITSTSFPIDSTSLPIAAEISIAADVAIATDPPDTGVTDRLDQITTPPPIQHNAPYLISKENPPTKQPLVKDTEVITDPPGHNPEIIKDMTGRLSKAVIEKSQRAFHVPDIAAHYVHMIPRSYVSVHHAPVKFVAPMPPAPPHYFGHYIPTAAFYNRRPMNGYYWQPKRRNTKLYEFDFSGNGGMNYLLPTLKKTNGVHTSDLNTIGTIGGNQQPGGDVAPVFTNQPDTWFWSDDVTSAPLVIGKK